MNLWGTLDDKASPVPLRRFHRGIVTVWRDGVCRRRRDTGSFGYILGDDLLRKSPSPRRRQSAIERSGQSRVSEESGRLEGRLDRRPRTPALLARRRAPRSFHALPIRSLSTAVGPSDLCP